MKSLRAFTLIELLIVIAIIGILMALLFPAVGGAIDAARKAQAKNDVTQIATALVAYETEYGRFPTALPESKTAITSNNFQALIGTTTNDNPRKITFIEVNNVAGKKGKSGFDSSGNFVDPWGGTYQIIVDKDYNNDITGAGGTDAIANPGTLRKKVAVWNTNSNTRRRVASWE